jgi:hypothetical protein
MLTFLIRFTMPISGDFLIDSVPKIRNFAEELMLEMKEEGIGTLDDIDTATTQLVVRMSSPRERGRARRLLRRLLKKHYLDADSVVTEH